MKRIEAKQKGGRQTLARSRMSTDNGPKDGSEIARQKMNSLLNQGSQSTQSTHSHSHSHRSERSDKERRDKDKEREKERPKRPPPRPTVSAPRPNNPPPKPTDVPKTTSPNVDRSISPISPTSPSRTESSSPTPAKPSKPPGKAMLSQSASVATFAMKSNSLNTNQRPVIKKQNSSEGLGMIKPQMPPPRRRQTLAQPEENSTVIAHVLDNEQRIEELQKLVDKLMRKIEQQEALIAHLNEINQQDYQNQSGGYYDANGGYYDENGNYYPPE